MECKMLKIIKITLLIILISSCNNVVIDPGPVPIPTPQFEIIGDPGIRFNQLGYFPKSEKIVVVVNSDETAFSIVDSDMNTVFTGELKHSGNWKASAESVKIGDFTALETSGNYKVIVNGIVNSYDFQISNDIYSDALKGTLKSYYYLRSSLELKEEYAGKWARNLGHPDDYCILDSSTGKSGSISSPGGWYDAGDFGKYIVNAGITVSTLLSLYELYPNAVGDDLNIPESGNLNSDLLDEVKYELNWMKTMQDDDGGIFFKLGTEHWPGSVMPENDYLQRYIYGKSTSSTLNFAANMAQAGRVYSSINPSYAADCVSRAKSAWDWAVINNNIVEPSHTGGTGPYNDSDYNDEFLWAASELYITTGEDPYRLFIEDKLENIYIKGKAWWQDTQNLALFSLISNSNGLNSQVLDKIKDEIIKYGNLLVGRANVNPYKTPIIEDDFTWGSHSSLCNYGVLLAYAYELTNDKKYLDATISILDYIFGKNATGYTAVTGFGDNPPMNPHHRQSEADNILEPVPGFVVGGPNRKHEDSEYVSYPNDIPAKSYVDIYNSYASNENAINQNAPLVFLLGFVNNYKGVLTN